MASIYGRLLQLQIIINHVQFRCHDKTGNIYHRLPILNNSETSFIEWWKRMYLITVAIENKTIILNYLLSVSSGNTVNIFVWIFSYIKLFCFRHRKSWRQQIPTLYHNYRTRQFYTSSEVSRCPQIPNSPDLHDYLTLCFGFYAYLSLL